MAGGSPARSGRAREFGRLLRLTQVLWVVITPSWLSSTSRNPTNRKITRRIRPLTRDRTIGTEGSNPSRSAKHIWTPPRARVAVQTRFGTRLQSYIRPARRASDEALGLDGFPRASFRYQSGGLAGHAWRQSWEAPVRPVHHQRHTTHPTQPRQERFSVPHQSLITRGFAPRALLTAGGEPGRTTACVATLVER